MTADCFLDTNILLYAGSRAPEDQFKREIAGNLITPMRFGISTQVVQEYIANALRKRALGLTSQNIDALLASLEHIPVAPITVPLIRQAWALRSRFQLSHWDSTIVAAAMDLKCRILYSEDLGHGNDYDGLQIINPFMESA